MRGVHKYKEGQSDLTREKTQTKTTGEEYDHKSNLFNIPT